MAAHSSSSLCDLADADGARLMTGLRNQGGATSAQKSRMRASLSTWTKPGTGQPVARGLDAHRELVAEVARRRLAHAGHAQMFAQRRRLFEVEVVQRHDAIDQLAPREVAHTDQQVLELPLLLHVRHEEHLGDALARPSRVAQALGGDEQDATPEAMRFADEVMSLVVGRQAQDRHRGILPDPDPGAGSGRARKAVRYQVPVKSQNKSPAAVPAPQA